MTVEQMIERGVYQVRIYHTGPRLSVTLTDGRHGVGRTFTEALAKAEAPDAYNTKAAA